MSFISCMCFLLHLFLSSHSQLPPRKSRTNKPWHTFFLREPKLFIRQQISLGLTAGCQMWRACFAVRKYPDEGSCRHWGYHLMYVHWNNKKPIIEANKVLEVIKLIHLAFFISITSLIHWDIGNLTLVKSHFRWMRMTSAWRHPWVILSLVLVHVLFSHAHQRSKTINFNQTGGATE